MSRSPRMGAKIRALRRQQGLTQAQMAAELGVSTSYLNLIENNRRPLTASLLIKLVRRYQVDLDTFSQEDDARLLAGLREVMGDRMFEESELTLPELREEIGAAPKLAAALLRLYRAYQDTEESVRSLAERLSEASDASPGESGDGTSHADGIAGRFRTPAEEVSDALQYNLNHYPDLERAAEWLFSENKPGSGKLRQNLTNLLKRRHGIHVSIVSYRNGDRYVRRFNRQNNTLELSEILPPRSLHFQLAHQFCLLEHSDLLDELAERATLTTPQSKAIYRVALANYFASAVMMPYAPFLEAARAVRYDVELLGHRFRASFEQVCHRLTTLQRPGASGVPFHFIRVDIAGNISKRFSASGIRFARFSGACPRWNVHAAFLTPGMIRTQVSTMPDGSQFFCFARTLRKARGGYHGFRAMQAIGLGCQLHYAREMVYADGIALDSPRGVPVGVSCRICERMDCAERAFPSVQHPVKVDEDLRGLSFYAPIEP